MKKITMDTFLISNEDIMEPTEFFCFIAKKKFSNVHSVSLTYKNKIPIITLSLDNNENSIILATTHQIDIQNFVKVLCKIFKVEVGLIVNFIYNQTH